MRTCAYTCIYNPLLYHTVVPTTNVQIPFIHIHVLYVRVHCVNTCSMATVGQKLKRCCGLMSYLNNYHLYITVGYEWHLLMHEESNKTLSDKGVSRSTGEQPSFIVYYQSHEYISLTFYLSLSHTATCTYTHLYSTLHV